MPSTPGPPTEIPLLRMRGIRKSFPGVKALKGVDITLQAGEVLALLGENGAGKSTTMRILTTFMAATSGSVRVGGDWTYERIQQSTMPGYAETLTTDERNDLVAYLFSLRSEP